MANGGLRKLLRKSARIFSRTLLSRTSEGLPSFELQPQHCEGARILANRSVLLEHLPAQAVVAELGVDQGNFSALILEKAAPKKLHLIDIWGTARYGQDKAQSVENRFAAEIAAGKVQITRALSTEASIHFPDNYFDWIYVDTSHSYTNTIAELYSYAAKIKPGGFIAGHDYTMGNWEKNYKYGVIEAVAEFCVRENWKIAFLTANHVEGNSFALTKI